MSSERARAADARRRVTELVRAARTCVLVTFGLDGRLTGRPMALQGTEFDGVSSVAFWAAPDGPRVDLLDPDAGPVLQRRPRPGENREAGF
ncbi:hypothetical protein ABGB16_02020 [Micromonospora sp. B11E3]|uniref:hypothetical protein n=1 Tax=Micromonospora sp. B11E3 TaxID=3153562 RepID=UPI00325F44BC